MAQYSCAQADGDREVRLAERERERLGTLSHTCGSRSTFSPQGSGKSEKEEKKKIGSDRRVGGLQGTLKLSRSDALRNSKRLWRA